MAAVRDCLLSSSVLSHACSSADPYTNGQPFEASFTAVTATNIEVVVNGKPFPGWRMRNPDAVADRIEFVLRDEEFPDLFEWQLGERRARRSRVLCSWQPMCCYVLCRGC